MNRLLVLIVGCLLLAGCTSQINYTAPEMPSPFLPSEGQTLVYFNDLPASCTIEIYTLDGQLVRTIVESDGDGQASWDTTNSSGQLLSSGTYDYVIKSSDGQKRGNLVIIR